MRFCLFLSLSAICSFAFTGCGGGGSSDSYTNAEKDTSYHWTDGPAVDKFPAHFKINVVLSGFNPFVATGDSVTMGTARYDASYTYEKRTPTSGLYTVSFKVPERANYSVTVYEILCNLVFSDDSKTGTIGAWTVYYRIFTEDDENGPVFSSSGNQGTFVLQY